MCFFSSHNASSATIWHRTPCLSACLFFLILRLFPPPANFYLWFLTTDNWELNDNQKHCYKQVCAFLCDRTLARTHARTKMTIKNSNISARKKQSQPARDVMRACCLTVGYRTKKPPYKKEENSFENWGQLRYSTRLTGRPFLFQIHIFLLLDQVRIRACSRWTQCLGRP